MNQGAIPEKRMELVNPPGVNHTTMKPIDDIHTWNISLSFGKSRSKNFQRALFLAKKAPQYFEDNSTGSEIFQATYSSRPKDYLAFVKLYEMVSKWKSSYVAICGESVDQKIIGQLNYCYGDKCRSGDPSFCYGASFMTENPFGCHRLQISACNHPWWSFGILDTSGVWHLDSEAIITRIRSYAKIYRFCPSFSEELILKAFDSLPKTINPKTSPMWEYNSLGGIEPKNHPGQCAVKISVSIEQPQKKNILGRIFDFFAGKK